jgi:hypothetical protein
MRHLLTVEFVQVIYPALERYQQEQQQQQPDQSQRNSSDHINASQPPKVSNANDSGLDRDGEGQEPMHYIG